MKDGPVIVNRFEPGAPDETVSVRFPRGGSVALPMRITRIVVKALIDAGIEVRALWYDTWGREQKIDQRIKRGTEH